MKYDGILMKCFLEDNEIEPTPTREVEDEGKILSVTIHRTDKLKNDFYILHPLVRVHVVDESTGKYLSKQHRYASYLSLQNENLNINTGKDDKNGYHLMPSGCVISVSQYD